MGRFSQCDGPILCENTRAQSAIQFKRAQCVKYFKTFEEIV